MTFIETAVTAFVVWSVADLVRAVLAERRERKAKRVERAIRRRLAQMSEQSCLTRTLASEAGLIGAYTGGSIREVLVAWREYVETREGIFRKVDARPGKEQYRWN